MKEIKIEHLAYLLKQARESKHSQPIFFLGAGASHSGNIPLAGEIVEQILKDFSDNPFVRDLAKEERTYPKLMGCLLPAQRNELLKKYIDDAKINVTHIYLAQLLKEGFVDYVLTVNFDNLMLRALALYNVFPATYDMAILKDLTTSTFNEKSVVYLHGQNHGLWLLNTQEELDKVKSIVPRIFDSIKNRRPWVFIGYSGEDPIFDHIKKLGRFDNGLYWVTHNDYNPNEAVQRFLSEPNTNASIIKGYDSDSFMLRLNNELGLGQPSIVDKPFTALKEMLNEIVDIDDKEYFKGVKVRLEISKKQVEEARSQFELGKVESSKDIEENKIDLLKKEIINLLISGEFQEEVISDLEQRVDGIPDDKLQSLLSNLYSYWGSDLGKFSESKEGDAAGQLHYQSIEKFKKAIEIQPDNYLAYNNWGVGLGDFAKTKQKDEAEQLYKQSFEKFQKAIEINPDSHLAYYNWGNYLGKLAKTKEGDVAEQLYKQSFEKFQKTIEIRPDIYEAYFNWGNCLGNLAETKKGVEAEQLYKQSFEKFQKAIEIQPDNYLAYYNWGNYLGDLAVRKEGDEAEQLYKQSFEKFQKAIEIKPDKYEAYNNWGSHLINFAKTKEGDVAELLYKQSFEKFQKAIELKPDNYLSYCNWGICLGSFAKAKEENVAERLYKQSFEKFQKAIELKPDNHKAYYHWGSALAELAKIKEGEVAEQLYKQSYEKLKKSAEMDGNCYNLACYYAIKKKKSDALIYLDLSLKKKEISVSYVESDEDWKYFLLDKDFLNIIKKYKA